MVTPLYKIFKARLPLRNLKSKSEFILTTLFFLFVNHISFAQTTSSIPNKYFTPDNYEAFQMSTFTDAVLYTEKTLQAVVATTPDPVLYWDADGHKGSLNFTSNITGFNPESTIFLDDISLCYNVNLFAYISCRVINSNHSTDLYVLICKWDFSSHSFFLSSSKFIINRATHGDYFDRMSIDVNKVRLQYDPHPFVLAYSFKGDIYYNEAKIDFGEGELFFNYNDYGKKLFQGTNLGEFSKPDVSNQSSGHAIVGAVCEANSNNTIKNEVWVKTSDVYFNDPAILAYAESLDDPHYYILRTLRLEVFNKYDFVLAFDRLDKDILKSQIIVVGKYSDQQSPTPAMVINEELNQLCDGNTTYWQYTGFPDIRVTNKDEPYEWVYFDVVWQQVFCTERNECNSSIQAISKRFLFSDAGGSSISPRGASEYYHINSTLARNSFFPSLAALPLLDCATYYSFGIMDKITNDFGQIGYKNANCISETLRPVHSNISASENTAAQLQIYPNPARDMITIKPPADFILSEVSLFTSTGKKIISNYVDGRLLVKIPTAQLATGIYYVKAISKNGNSITQKAVIIH